MEEGTSIETCSSLVQQYPISLPHSQALSLRVPDSRQVKEQGYNPLRSFLMGSPITPRYPLGAPLD